MNFAKVVVLILLVFPSSFAQALMDAKTDGTTKPDARPAQELYEDANGYLGRRYQEFNKKKVAYDPQLEAKTRKEQQELALKNAAILKARSSNSADDVYHLGMLYHLAGDVDNALATMRSVFPLPICA